MGGDNMFLFLLFLRQLARSPRRAVLNSLVEDLTHSPSVPSDLRTSPFRIVRVVDRSGDIKAIR